MKQDFSWRVSGVWAISASFLVLVGFKGSSSQTWWRRKPGLK